MADKWMAGAVKRPGALKEAIGEGPEKKIPSAKLDGTIASLRKQAEGDKKLSVEKRRLLRQAVLARTFRRAS